MIRSLGSALLEMTKKKTAIRISACKSGYVNVISSVVERSNQMKQYFVYILSSISGVLYVGVTNNLKKRVWEHKVKATAGFVERYNVNKLIYFEQRRDVLSVIGREKQLKKWNRSKKIGLIESVNPDRNDLYDKI